LLLYRNRLQLATTDALYSDGDQYLPAVIVAKNLQSFLPSAKNVLILGSGLGSMVYVLHKNGFYPHFTIVDNDKVVLEWAMEFLDKGKTDIEPVCSDAMAFMQHNSKKYDLVFIDVFNSRVVPEFVTSTAFLQLCHNSLVPGGHLAFNYIVNDKMRWERVKDDFSLMFPNNKITDLGLNRVLIS
jgi:spermidine synthase